MSTSRSGTQCEQYFKDKKKRRRSDEQIREDPELAYLLLQVQPMAVIQTKFIVLRKAA